MTEAELERLIFATARAHLRYGTGTWEELKNPYCGNDEQNEHQTTIWATVRREVENEWVHSFGLPEYLGYALWRSVESQLEYDTGVTADYPEIHPSLLDWINA